MQLTVKEEDTLVFLSKLLRAKTSLEVGRATDQYPHKTGWFPFNRDEQNLTGIRSIDDPMRAIIEVVTNGIDAVVERALVEKGIDLSAIKSPHEAVNAVFPDDASKANKVKVTVFPQPGTHTATVKVLDYGCGISPQDAWDTILGLSKGRKKMKMYTIGTWGIGAASGLRLP